MLVTKVKQNRLYIRINTHYLNIHKKNQDKHTQIYQCTMQYNLSNFKNSKQGWKKRFFEKKKKKKKQSTWVLLLFFWFYIINSIF